ncbi:hypothetical protein Ahy_A09g043086 [Arachis hypogaea]|uniref:MULE transposase domain-containing protein n=1 Tax=Arachis hypogaea TaxID=3818 RepID=A0A445BHJ4_ARAHY|nr:hypothetical protein Ahy_A09g043086 [Arachis hypogaea]
MDGKSRVDFEEFVDVMAFDATYKKNNTIMADEGEETYIWLLQRFVKAMNGKRPDVVIIDGAKAMKLAIERIFSYACMP